MTRVIGVLAMIGALQAQSFATWSVLALDRATGRLVIASATCLALEEPQTLKTLQAVVVPGVGVAACQALIDVSGTNQRRIFEELRKGSDPREIIRFMRSDRNVEQRQYGIVDSKGRVAGFTGDATGKAALDRQGQVPNTGIFYSIQGNILTAANVVNEAVKAFTQTDGALTDRVMAAMEAADRAGGDSRCTCDTTPRANAPCDGKTSHVAYILMTEENDPIPNSPNNGKYALYISVTQGNTKSSENANPVKTLRMRYDVWRNRQPASFK
jgi:hypothetical protein